MRGRRPGQPGATFPRAGRADAPEPPGGHDRICHAWPQTNATGMRERAGTGTGLVVASASRCEPSSPTAGGPGAATGRGREDRLRHPPDAAGAEARRPGRAEGGAGSSGRPARPSRGVFADGHRGSAWAARDGTGPVPSARTSPMESEPMAVSEKKESTATRTARAYGVATTRSESIPKATKIDATGGGECIHPSRALSPPTRAPIPCLTAILAVSDPVVMATITSGSPRRRRREPEPQRDERTIDYPGDREGRVSGAWRGTGAGSSDEAHPGWGTDPARGQRRSPPATSGPREENTDRTNRPRSKRTALLGTRCAP